MKTTEAMIFAAGLGTRLRPLTDSMPKALVPVCGKPLLQIVIDRLVSFGIRDIVVNVHHLLGADRFLVHNVDIISDLDLEWLDSSVRSDALATLAVSERKTSRYLLFDDDMRLKGWTNISTGEVRSPYPDLDPSRCRRYAFSGIHIISHDIFGAFRDKGFCGKFPIMDFYLRAAAEYPVYGAVPKKLELADVGKPETLARAREMSCIEKLCRF